MLFLLVRVPEPEPLLTCNVNRMYAALSFNSSDESFVGNRGITGRNLGVVFLLALLEMHFFFLFAFPSQMKAVLSNLDLLVEGAKQWNFQIPSSN
jgi:hypothetical protein